MRASSVSGDNGTRPLKGERFLVSARGGKGTKVMVTRREPSGGSSESMKLACTVLCSSLRSVLRVPKRGISLYLIHYTSKMLHKTVAQQKISPEVWKQKTQSERKWPHKNIVDICLTTLKFTAILVVVAVRWRLKLWGEEEA